MTLSLTLFSLAGAPGRGCFSDIVRVRNRIVALRSEGSAVDQFEGGEPYINTPDDIQQALVEALAENKTRYAPSSGIQPLRAAIAQKVREKPH